MFGAYGQGMTTAQPSREDGEGDSAFRRSGPAAPQRDGDIERARSLKPIHIASHHPEVE